MANSPANLAAVTPARSTGNALALALAGVAAMLASTCCVVPLLLAIVGVSGAWISLLRGLSPYSTSLIVTALCLLAIVGRQLYGQPTASRSTCDSNGVECCTVSSAVRRGFWLVVVLTLIPVAVPLLAPLFY